MQWYVNSSRKEILLERDHSLKDVLVDGRKFQASTAQASGMEDKFRVVRLNQIAGKPNTCYNIRFDYPHQERPCPAAVITCNLC